MEGEKQKQMLDREIHDMISALNRRLQLLHKPHGGGDSSHIDDDDDDEGDEDHGVRVITLAGTNVGATMRSELDDDDDDDLDGDAHHDPLTAFVNSNFQAINNSLMLGGSYTTNDPGVHLEISDHYDNIMQQESKADNMQQKRAKKKESGIKNKLSKTFKSEHHSEGKSDD